MQFLQQNKPLILASTSAVRKQILEATMLNFQAIAPLFNEEEGKQQNPHLTIAQLAMFLAENKALSVSQIHKNALVIGSDQICEFDDKGIDKSKNADEAIVQLTNFSGKIHYQNNATVVAKNGKIIFRKISRVKLKMRKISANDIHSYVSADKPWGCAGSYKYESLGKHLFEKISGDYYSILGLNLQPLLCFLHRKNYINIT